MRCFHSRTASLSPGLISNSRPRFLGSRAAFGGRYNFTFAPSQYPPSVGIRHPTNALPPSSPCPAPSVPALPVAAVTPPRVAGLPPAACASALPAENFLLPLPPVPALHPG